MGFAPAVRGSVLLSAVLGVSTAYADGVCEKGMRDTTPAERQTMTGVMAAVRAAVPQAPAGWVIGGYEEEFSAVTSICRDAESTPWPYGFSRAFNRTDDVAARETAMAEVTAAVRAAHAARQPRQEALQVKVDALSKEFAAAAQSGDQARIAASQRAMEAVNAEYAAFFAEAQNPQHLEAIARVEAEDRNMSIGIDVNPGGTNVPDEPSVAPFAGAQSAYRWTTTELTVETAHVLLLYGVWEAPTGGGTRSGRRGTMSSAAAHAIAVRVEADPGRIDSLLGSIDFPAIAATLAR